MAACINGHFEVVKLLVKNGANINKSAKKTNEVDFHYQYFMAILTGGEKS